MSDIPGPSFEDGGEWKVVETSDLIAPKQELRPVEKFEVLANPPLENIKLIYSTPVYKEWKEGNLLKHVKAALSQKISGGSIESNYILNSGEDHLWAVTPDYESKKAFAREEQIQSIDFLKKVVEVQKLARQGPTNRAAMQQLGEIIQGESDLLIKDLLKLAAHKADQVAISAVSVKNWDQLTGHQYSSGNYIGSVRTVGFDYAYKRLEDDKAVFLMNDADTIPATNHFIEDLLNVYDTSPEVKYVFLGLSYQPPGEDKAHVGKSMQEAGFRMSAYNWWASGAPQISFRKEVMENIQGIATGIELYEDYETAKRLRAFYSTIQSGVLMQEAVFVPTHLTADRSTGFVDGAGRERGVQDMDVYFDKARTDMGRLTQTISELDQTTQERVNQQFNSVRERYVRQQKVLLRANKQVVTTFLKNLESGNIKILDGQVQLNESQILQDRNSLARPMLSFIRSNQELVASLNQDDLDLMRYYTQGGEFPSQIKQLDQFQLALREYIGDYPEVDNLSLDQLARLSVNRGLTDKTSIFQPYMAEILSLGNIAGRLTTDIDGNNRDEFLNMGKNLAERSAWLDQSLPKRESPAQSAKVESRLKRFATRYLPFGFLAQMVAKRS